MREGAEAVPSHAPSRSRLTPRSGDGRLYPGHLEDSVRGFTPSPRLSTPTPSDRGIGLQQSRQEEANEVVVASRDGGAGERKLVQRADTRGSLTPRGSRGRTFRSGVPAPARQMPGGGSVVERETGIRLVRLRGEGRSRDQHQREQGRRRRSDGPVAQALDRSSHALLRWPSRYRRLAQVQAGRSQSLSTRGSDGPRDPYVLTKTSVHATHTCRSQVLMQWGRPGQSPLDVPRGLHTQWARSRDLTEGAAEGRGTWPASRLSSGVGNTSRTVTCTGSDTEKREFDIIGAKRPRVSLGRGSQRPYLVILRVGPASSISIAGRATVVVVSSIIVRLRLPAPRSPTRGSSESPALVGPRVWRTL